MVIRPEGTAGQCWTQKKKKKRQKTKRGKDTKTARSRCRKKKKKNRRRGCAAAVQATVGATPAVWWGGGCRRAAESGRAGNGVGRCRRGRAPLPPGWVAGSSAKAEKRRPLQPAGRPAAPPGWGAPAAWVGGRQQRQPAGRLWQTAAAARGGRGGRRRAASTPVWAPRPADRGSGNDGSGRRPATDGRGAGEGRRQRRRRRATPPPRPPALSTRAAGRQRRRLWGVLPPTPPPSRSPVTSNSPILPPPPAYS